MRISHRIYLVFLFLLLLLAFQVQADELQQSGHARLQDLPTDVQAQIKAQSNTNTITEPGLRISEDLQSFLYGGYHSGLQTYTATLHRSPEHGVEVKGANSQYAVGMVPLIAGLEKGFVSGERIAYTSSTGMTILYEFKRNGLKEDIVLNEPPSGDVTFSFALNLDSSMEAKLDGKGNILVYGPSGFLSGNIQIGDQKSADLISKARSNAPKDQLMYAIPAPVVFDASGRQYTDRCYYTLQSNIIVLHASNLDVLQAPVRIDPSIVVTTTPDFQTGNNEGMISLDTDAVSRGVQTAGRASPLGWQATTSLAKARFRHASVAYNGRLYVIGGYTDFNNEGYLNDILYTDVDVNGAVLGWQTATNPFPTARNAHAAVAYNGYLYVLGGHNGTFLNDVEFAPINSNGDIGTWQSTNSFFNGRYGFGSFAYNGYLYVVGGVTTGGDGSDVQLARIRADGGVQSWTSTTGFANPRWGITSVAYNGFIYVIGGQHVAAYYGDVYYAPLLSNGTIAAGSWKQTTAFSTPRNEHATVVHNGYLYVIGGYDGTYLNNSLYAPINANGTVGIWRSTGIQSPAGSSGVAQHTAVMLKDRMYVIGGDNSAAGYRSNVHRAGFAENGGLGGWTFFAGDTIGAARANQCSVAYNGFVYLMGGIDSTGTTVGTVTYAKFNPDGTHNPWQSGPVINWERYDFGCTVYNSKIYILGGTLASFASGPADVQYIAINPDGSMGLSWTTTTPLPTDLGGLAAVAYNGYLYILGGRAFNTFYNNAYYIPLNPDGSLGAAWTSTATFTGARAYHTAVVYNGYLYVLGGNNSSTTFQDVWFTSFNSNGSLNTWSTTTSMITARKEFATVAYNGYIYVLGGLSSGGANLVDFHIAPVKSDGTLGPWTDPQTPFNVSRHAFSAVASNGILYVMGGNSFTGVRDDIQLAPLQSNGLIDSWTLNGAYDFPLGWAFHAAVAYNGYLYITGGANPPSLYTSATSFAPIQTDGTLGSWNVASNNFTDARYRHTAVAYKGYLYVIAGNDPGGNQRSDVQYAPILSNGDLGPWNAVNLPSLNTARSGHTSVVYKGFIYVLGGDNASPGTLNDVEYSQIGSNGTLGPWITSPKTFTTGRFLHTSVAYNGYLYVIGGYTGTDYANDVQFAPINSDGSIGDWAPTTSFEKKRNAHTSFAYNGFLYVMGGHDGTYLKDVQFAAFGANGRIGPWRHTTELPIAVYGSGADYNGWAYITGGYQVGDVLSNHVYIGRMNGSAARASYSRVVDVGSSQMINSVTMSGTAGTKGITNLTFAIGASGSPFSGVASVPDASSGVAYSGGPTCGRYVWVRFDLDDTRSTTVTDSWATGKKDVLDFTIDYNPLGSPGTSLRGGKNNPNVHLSWQAVPNALSYAIRRCNKSTDPCTADNQFAFIASTNAIFYDDSVLIDGTNYWYKIEAQNNSCFTP